jgi:hypothetical protein
LGFNPDALLRELVRVPDGHLVTVLPEHRAEVLERAQQDFDYYGELIDEDTRLRAAARMDLSPAELNELGKRAGADMLLEAFLACLTHPSATTETRARLAHTWALGDDELPSLVGADASTQAAWLLAPALVGLGAEAFTDLVLELESTPGALEALEVLARDAGVKRFFYGDTTRARELTEVALGL